MKQKSIESDQEFIRSLDPRQRIYFLEREAETASRLQASLAALARGVSVVSALNGEVLQNVLAEQP